MKALLPVVLAALCAAPVRAQGLDRSLPVPPAPARPYGLPPAEQATLANGMKVALIELHKLPLVGVTMLFPLAGSSTEPDGKAGLAGLVAGLMSEGTTTKDGRAFAEAVEDLGASVGFSATRDALTVTVFATKENIGQAVALAAEAVRHPAFAPEALEKARAESQASLQQEQGDPGASAEKRVVRRVFADSPYGRSPDAASLAAVTRGDLVAFHRRLVPSGAVLGASGDISLEELKAIAQKNFGSWQADAPALAAARPAPVPALGAVGRTGTGLKPITLVDFPDAEQSSIRVGAPTPAKGSPDEDALRLMNFILGQAPIMNRLEANLREAHGWAYGASSSNSALKNGGILVAEADVQTDKTAPALSEMLSEMAKLGTTPLADAEMAEAKRVFAGLLALQQRTVQSLAAQAAAIAVNGLAPDELAAFRVRLDRLTAEDVRRVAAQYLAPGALEIVISGDASKTADAVRSVGPVQVVGQDGRPRA